MDEGSVPFERVRLDAFLARAGVGTRSEVRRLIRRGRVTLDGAVCRRAAERVAGRPVALDGAAVAPAPGAVHVVLHKPVGYACSHDPAEAPIVDELLSSELLRVEVQPAGRLDRDTSGLLVLSTDGGLIHALTHPRRKTAKRYRVTYRGALPEDAVERFAEGMLLGGDERPTRPARLEVALEGATVVLHEGRFHQVRRMFRRLGVEVETLHRDRIGDYELPPDLAPGEVRALGDEDLALLRSESSL